MIRISKLAESVKPSATLAAGAKAKALKATGVKVYDFSLGEPDFNTPAHICAAANEAMAKGQTHYTPAGGTAELKTAIAKWYGRTYGYECKAENVIVSNGAKHSLHNALAATVGPGDEVIIPTPYWVSYSDLVSMTGATPVLVDATFESGFKMTPAQLKAAITPRTRVLMLNSPSNPTGTVYTRAELEALVDVYLEHSDGCILSDEIYEQLVYNETKATCVVTLRPQLKDRCITISGGEQELRDDRLAHRLGRGTRGRGKGDGHDSEPRDELPEQREPIRDDHGARIARDRPDGGSDAEGIRPAPGTDHPFAASDSQSEVARPGRSLLRLLRHFRLQPRFHRLLQRLPRTSPCESGTGRCIRRGGIRADELRLQRGNHRGGVGEIEGVAGEGGVDGWKSH